MHLIQLDERNVLKCGVDRASSLDVKNWENIAKLRCKSVFSFDFLLNIGSGCIFNAKKVANFHYMKMIHSQCIKNGTFSLLEWYTFNAKR